MLRFSLRAKVLTTVSVSLVLIFAGIIYLLANQNTRRQQSILNEQAKSFAALATKPIGDTFVLYKDSGTLKINQQIQRFLDLDPDVTGVRVVSIDGNTLFGNKNAGSSPIDAQLSSSFEPQTTKGRNGYVNQIVQPYFEDTGAHRYSVVYELSSQRLEQNLAEIVRYILYVGLAVLLISVATTVLLINRLVVNPIRKVSEAARVISFGDFDHQITSSRNDEIGDLAKSVSTMANSLRADISKLQEVDKLKSEFLMIISHNLRTPISIIKGNVEAASESENMLEMNKDLNVISTSVQNLELFAEDVLAISSLESSARMLAKSKTAAADFIERIYQNFETAAKQKDIKYTLKNEIGKSIMVEMSSTHMKTALSNIIDNAIKFTPEKGVVDVIAKAEPDQLIFQIDDNGIGIAETEMPKIFTKFHRGTSIMKYNYKGVGLGLYLAKLIIEQHGGSISLESTLGKGSHFKVILPKHIDKP